MPLRLPMLSLVAASSLAAHASAATYSITTPGTNNNVAVGQNFSPSVGGSPDPALAASDPVQLTSFTFTKGSAATGDAATRLVVLPGAYYDTNGADGTFVPTIADVTAISTNTIDTAAATDGTALNFVFANPTLTYGNDYSVAFATVGANDALTFIPVGVKYVDYVETAPGVFAPSSNYGGTGNFGRVTLYPDFNNDGFFEADNNTADLAFTANFTTPIVPEPASLAIILGASLLLTRRGR